MGRVQASLPSGDPGPAQEGLEKLGGERDVCGWSNQDRFPGGEGGAVASMGSLMMKQVKTFIHPFSHSYPQLMLWLSLCTRAHDLHKRAQRHLDRGEGCMEHRAHTKQGLGRRDR